MDLTLGILPIVVVLLGMIVFYRSGSFVDFVGWGLRALLAPTSFYTPLKLILGATVMGIIKAFGLTLTALIEHVRGLAKNKVEQALFLGMGFGSPFTALGRVTPAMFPPIFRLLGFSAFSSIALSILSCDPPTSLALFSIPITLPAKVAFVDLEINPPGITSISQFIWDYTFKTSLFLPVISVLIAMVILWTVGNKRALKESFLAYTKRLPVEVIGIVSGFATRLLVCFYFRGKSRQEALVVGKPFDLTTLQARSSLIFLVIISIVVNIPTIKQHLPLDNWEIISVFADKKEDLSFSLY